MGKRAAGDLDASAPASCPVGPAHRGTSAFPPLFFFFFFFFFAPLRSSFAPSRMFLGLEGRVLARGLVGFACDDAHGEEVLDVEESDGAVLGVDDGELVGAELACEVDGVADECVVAEGDRKSVV